MKNRTNQWLYWLPRALSILFAVFISLLALDVFGEGYSFGETLVALFMHLVPTFILVAVIAIAWRWERVGAALFLALAVLFMAVSRGEGWLIAGPLLLLGILFLFDWQVNAHLKTG